jgi:hypothetical protein
MVLDRLKLLPITSVRPNPSHLVDAAFGGAIRLIGYDSTTTATGLRVTLYWNDQAPVMSDFTVFVHVSDDTGRVLAQHDSPPRGGLYPTHVWEPGESIRDEHDITVPRPLIGPTRVLVGMYQPADGQRLSVTGSAATTPKRDAVELFDLPAG